MKLTCESAGMSGTYETEDQSLMMGMGAGELVWLKVKDACDGAVFSCNVEQLTSGSATINFVAADGVTNPFEHLTVKEKAGSKETPVSVTSNSLTTPYSGSTLLIFDAAEGYLLDIKCDNPALKDQFNTGDYTAIDVGSRNPKLFTPGTHWELYLYAGAAGATFTCTVSKASAPEPEPDPEPVAKYSATIKFVGANDLKDAYKYVTVNKLEDEGEEIGEEIPVESSELVLNYDDFCDVLLTAKENYKMTLTCDDPDLKNNQDYTITFYGDPLDFGKQFILSVLAASNEATFTCMVNKEGGEPEPQPENTVTINIVGANDLADAYKYVSVETEDEEELPVESAEFVLGYDEDIEVLISVADGYHMTMVCDDDMLINDYKTGDYYLDDYGRTMGESQKIWDLVAYASANGATFTCTVTKDEEPQPTPENSVTINFTGLEDAYKFVSMITEDDEEIPVEAASIVLDYDEMFEVLISAADGYHITVACDDNMLTNEFKTGDYFLEDINPQYTPDKEWDLAVYPGANGATFTVTVTDDAGVEATVANDDVTVYNLLGVKLLDRSNAAAINGLAPGLYIINGKKVNIRK